MDTGEEMPQDHEKLVEFFRQTSLPPCLTHTSPNDSLVRGLNRCSEILAREKLEHRRPCVAGWFPKRVRDFTDLQE